MLLGSTIVVAEHLLIEVTKQVERFDTHVSPLEATLQETPEVFHSIRVHFPAYVSFGMVNDLVDVITVESPISLAIICGQVRAGSDVLFHYHVQRVSFAVRRNFRSYVAAPLKDSDHNCLATKAAPVDSFPLVFVHETGLTADKSFICFDVPGEFSLEAARLHCFANAVQHEPCGLLGDSEITGNLVGTDTVLAIGNHPRCRKPFVQAQRRVLKDRSRFRGELPGCMMASALPLPLILEESRVRPSTGGADNSAGPAVLDHVGQAIVCIAKVDNRFLERFRFPYSFVFHAPSIAQSCGFVKYVVTDHWDEWGG